MAENLSTLAIDVSNEVGHILGLQQLLKICLNELDTNPSAETHERAALLVSTYLCQVEPHFQDLEVRLRRMRGLIAGGISD